MTSPVTLCTAKSKTPPTNQLFPDLSPDVVANEPVTPCPPQPTFRIVKKNSTQSSAI